MIDGRPSSHSSHFCYGLIVDHTHTHTIRENPLLPFLFDLLNRVGLGWVLRSSLDVHWPVAPVAAHWLVCLLPSEVLFHSGSVHFSYYTILTPSGICSSSWSQTVIPSSTPSPEGRTGLIALSLTCFLPGIGCLLPSELERRIFFVRYLPIFLFVRVPRNGRTQRAGPDLDVDRSSQAEGRRKLTIPLV